MERTLKIIVGVLAVGAVVLGYLIYVRDYKPLAGTTSQNPSTNAPQTPSTGVNLPAGSSYELSAEEKKALTPPSQNATAAEQKAFFDVVVSAAKTVPALEIGTSCSVKPVVLALKKGAPLKIKNTATVEQTIAFNKDSVYSVPAGETKEFKVAFAQNGGIYGYGCGSSVSASGMIFVTE
ncbi:hypothetical protein K8Q93_03760 [Candidatus Parcubacteria bacterium]|nr:hypothetical protein [Candidatus Parcubacteria bacterium]